MNHRVEGPHSEREMGVYTTDNRVTTVMKEGKLRRKRNRQYITGLIGHRWGPDRLHLGNIH